MRTTTTLSKRPPRLSSFLRLGTNLFSPSSSHPCFVLLFFPFSLHFIFWDKWGISEPLKSWDLLLYLSIYSTHICFKGSGYLYYIFIHKRVFDFGLFVLFLKYNDLFIFFFAAWTWLTLRTFHLVLSLGTS